MTTTKRPARSAAPNGNAPEPTGARHKAPGPGKRATAARRKAESGGVRVRLFDANRTDEALDLGPALKRRIDDDQLLWIDVEGPVDDALVTSVAERMDLRPSTRRELAQADRGAHLALHGS